MNKIITVITIHTVHVFQFTVTFVFNDTFTREHWGDTVMRDTFITVPYLPHVKKFATKNISHVGTLSLVYRGVKLH